jgi:hypothetical protein
MTVAPSGCRNKVVHRQLRRRADQRENLGSGKLKDWSARSGVGSVGRLHGQPCTSSPTGNTDMNAFR